MNEDSEKGHTQQTASEQEGEARAKESTPEFDAGAQERQKTQPPPEVARRHGKFPDRPGTSWLGWAVLSCTLVLALIVTVLAVSRSVQNPRTDDAEVFANLIGMAPQVEGPIVKLPIRDNQNVKTGQLLFVVDERPYSYALERAISERAALEGQIEDRQRYIRSQVSGVHVAQADVHSSDANRNAMSAMIAEAQADVVEATAALRRSEADRDYAADNLHRLEPLLAQQFVTVDQVDQARTLLETRNRAVQQAAAQVAFRQAHVQTNRSRFEQSNADVEQRQAQRAQAANGVETLAPLTGQLEERAAAIRLAQYNLNNCRVYAPFDGYVTNLTTAVGDYVHVGAQVFTMIDSRTWWVIANFRETQLRHVVLGSGADVFLMAHEGAPLHGIVESIGYGVTPDPSVVGVLAPGLPAVQRSLSWVHLASRYPVRIRIEAPPPALVRIGENAVAVIHPTLGAGR